MKRVITAVIFIIFAVTLCLTGYAICLNKLNSINKELGEAAYVVQFQDEEKMLVAAKDVKKEWEKSSNLLYALIIHSELDEIENNIDMLSFYAESGNFYEFNKACEESISISKHIIDSQKTSFKNIF